VARILSTHAQLVKILKILKILIQNLATGKMVSTLYLKRLDDGKMTHHAAAGTIPTNALSIKILEIL